MARARRYAGYSIRMKIGITGIRGFIGAEVERALSAQGHETVALDAFTRPADRMEVDADHPKGLKWVLHFGATTSIEQSWKDPFYTYKNNIDSTLAALKIAQASNAAFLFMSSYVYGKPEYLPVDEKHLLEAVNPYMSSKIVCEDICRQLCKTISMPLVVLRGSNIFGSAYVRGRLIPELLESAGRGEQLTITDPLPKRDYLYIKDFYGLIIKIVDMEPPASGTYNVGYGRSYSNMEIAEVIKRLSASKYPVAVKSTPRPNDILDASVDVSLVKKSFSWEPRYSLEKGLEELVRQKLRG